MVLQRFISKIKGEGPSPFEHVRILFFIACKYVPILKCTNQNLFFAKAGIVIKSLPLCVPGNRREYSLGTHLYFM